MAPPQLCPGTGRTLVAASRRGRSHAHVGAFRDDDYALHADPNSGWHVLAVADGAGSAQYSRKGSQLAVQTSVRFVAEQLATRQGGDLEHAVEAHHTSSIRDRVYDVLGGAAHASVKAIQAEAKRINTPVKDFSTTLLLAAHKKMAAGEFVAAYWVGDGGVGVYKRGESIELLGEGDSGEYAGQTRFLDQAVMTSEEIDKRLRFTLVDDFTSLILMTDGISDPKFETDNNLRSIAYWDSLWSEIESGLRAESTGSPPEEFLLTWLDFFEAGNHDDRTIAVLF